MLCAFSMNSLTSTGLNSSSCLKLKPVRCIFTHKLLQFAQRNVILFLPTVCQPLGNSIFAGTKAASASPGITHGVKHFEQRVDPCFAHKGTWASSKTTTLAHSTATIAPKSFLSASSSRAFIAARYPLGSGASFFVTLSTLTWR